MMNGKVVLGPPSVKAALVLAIALGLSACSETFGGNGLLDATIFSLWFFGQVSCPPARLSFNELIAFPKCLRS